MNFKVFHLFVITFLKGDFFFNKISNKKIGSNSLS